MRSTKQLRNSPSFDSLVLDLRGHLGGGLGVLRLMSHLTPDKLPIGYTVTRKRAETGFRQEHAAQARSASDRSSEPSRDRIDGNSVRRSRSICSAGIRGTRSQTLAQPGGNPHERTTVSAGEMVAAFASENGLAKLVGTETRRQTDTWVGL